MTLTRADIFVEEILPTLRMGLSILDVGCGDGALVLRLKELGHDILGIDEKESPHRLCEISALENYAPARQFDIVIARLSLHHTKHAPRTFEHLRRLTKSNGYLIVEEFAGDEIDEKTASWADAHLLSPSPAGLSPDEKPKGLIGWKLDHPDSRDFSDLMHNASALFDVEKIIRVPYLVWLYERPELFEFERQAIHDGKIIASGIIVVFRPRALFDNRWDEVFSANANRFGLEPSFSAKLAGDYFGKLPVAQPHLLDLGAGSGRDALYFAKLGLNVVALDFSQVALDALGENARESDELTAITTLRHNVREPLPFPDASFDACYSHMLFCMDFTFDELQTLAREVRRVLKPEGLHIYTARTTSDPDFGIGIHHGEQRYEDDGFTVHFFDRNMVERLAIGFEVLVIVEFDEGTLPRHLFMVTLKKLLS